MNEYNGMVKKPSVCFVSLDNYAALVDDPKYGRIGGAEIQQAIIARELVKRGYKVSFITLDDGQDDRLEIDGIRIIKAYDRNVGIPVLRFVHPRLTGLWRAMKSASADVYYQRTRDSTTGIMAAFCRRYDRACVFALASNLQCMIDPPYRLPMHVRILYRYGLWRANLVIAQTATQQRLLRENFGVNSRVIPNCTPDNGRCGDGADSMVSNRRRRFLWVGNFSPVKRLELLLDIAEQCHDLQFDVVGDGNRQSEYVQRLRSRAESLPNVHLYGKVPHATVQQFYLRTKALICTSPAEGFPNTFLEAWSYGVPIVSTFDPDSLIADNGLGVVAQDVPGLAAGIRALRDCPQHWLKASQAARQYYIENHTVEVVMPRFENALLSILINK